MLQTVEAEIDANGNITFSEPLKVRNKARIIITVLEESSSDSEEKGDGQQILQFLQSPEFVNRKSYPAEEIEAQIEEARNSWE